VLERMVGPFEHMLRNSVVHGIELPAERSAAGKDPTGTIRVRVSQVGNEVGVEFGDDGRGLDLPRIRERALDRGLLQPDVVASDEELAQLIFVPGFSTAGTVSELAGRGIGMDVVRSEVNAMGGRIETHSTPQQGARFRLVLPLTTAVTQVVLLGAAGLTVAVPSSLVEVVRRVPLDDVRRAYASGQLPLGDHEAPFFWLPELLDGSGQGPLEGRTQMVVVVQSASQRVALHVEDVIGNQEVVVKNVGPQLSHMPGLAGVTLLPSGAAALIYNPVALAALYGEEISARRQQVPTAKPEALAPVIAAAPAPVAKAPLVMVVDDSLTVRRVTQRLLEREGYRVVLAKDGMDALEKLAEVRPIVMLCDIEMPRMDGFELVRVLRSDPERADIPVVMITSRIAQKHRDHASQLGVQHYLGKPYPEDRLLALVAEYASAEATA
jgi:chemosensory pili system protein ChpA (sensor histidine kinase/response regulator)